MFNEFGDKLEFCFLRRFFDRNISAKSNQNILFNKIGSKCGEMLKSTQIRSRTVVIIIKLLKIFINDIYAIEKFSHSNIFSIQFYEILLNDLTYLTFVTVFLLLKSQLCPRNLEAVTQIFVENSKHWNSFVDSKL